ncbi:hypothetical protein PF010_g2581 [Phytophthora fragariae]|uniref:Purple acid phosphatase C-terminal domain-containing protein n=1 Tax=Phytophthora fragariae TaxID=53985 RepID=A0A6G0LWN8_9STRA|nr:hypothetical protein PF010_g2581 [Phytophthora fragariae]KAE9225194.1 hypothetical protein PF004_g11982 [Phytophthora fragariae]KAE9355979.1 hypothetical protein PF008_g3820 [Phytophthora fragariae]
MDGVSRDNKTYENPQTPVYVVTETAGGPEGLFVYQDPLSPEWLVLMDNKHFSITRLSASPTNLTLAMIESATGIIHDEFSIIKSSATQDSTQ